MLRVVIISCRGCDCVLWYHAQSANMCLEVMPMMLGSFIRHWPWCLLGLSDHEHEAYYLFMVSCSWCLVLAYEIMQHRAFFVYEIMNMMHSSFMRYCPWCAVLVHQNKPMIFLIYWNQLMMNSFRWPSHAWCFNCFIKSCPWWLADLSDPDDDAHLLYQLVPLMLTLFVRSCPWRFTVSSDPARDVSLLSVLANDALFV